MTSQPALGVAVALTVLLCGAAGCTREKSPDEATAGTATVAQPRLVFAEHRDGITTFWAARPDEPADRRQIATVRHDPEWGIRASLSPDGRRVAYTAMPPGGRDPDGDAVLTILDLDGKTSRRLATGIDLRTPPVWRGDDRVIVQRRGPIGAGVLVEIEANGDERPLLAAEAGRRLFPIGVVPDGRLYVADLGSGETRLRVVEPQGAVYDTGPLTDGSARGFALAPDGSSLAFLSLGMSDDTRRYRAHVIDLNSKEVRPLRPDRERAEDTGVLWAGDGFAVSAIDGESGILLGVSPEQDRMRASGFDAATMATSDGHWTAVRSFESGSPNAPGPEQLELVSEDGRRTTVDAAGGVTVIGWTES
ncbi:MAG: TolB family protein [Dehalococcoidia bacterium]